MRSVRFLGIVVVVGLLAATACKPKVEPPKEVETFSCDTLDNLLTPQAVVVDKQGAAEGGGALKMVAEQPATIPLYDMKFPGEGAKFTLRYKMKVKDFLGDAYGQMDVNFASGGKQEVKNYQTALGATSDWLDRELVYTVQKGQKVNSITFSAVLGGSGTVWVDDVHLIRAPLP